MCEQLRRSADYRRSAVSLRIYAGGLAGRLCSNICKRDIHWRSGVSLVVVVELLVLFEQRCVVTKAAGSGVRLCTHVCKRISHRRSGASLVVVVSIFANVRESLPGP